jgi:hypothetical protein
MTECKFNPFETMYVDGVNIHDIGAVLESYTVSGTEITNEVYQGRNRTNFNLLVKQFGRKTVTVTVFFHSIDRHMLTLKQSKLTSMLTGVVELALPDGFYYRCTLDKVGDLQIIGVDGKGCIAECIYTLMGIQHDVLQTVTGNVVYAEGTLWQMDCILTCTASRAYTSIQVGTVTFTGVSAGDVLVADGINGRLLQNGTPTTGNASFTHLPFLVPGKQIITCPETLTVQYYPSYI